MKYSIKIKDVVSNVLVPTLSDIISCLPLDKNFFKKKINNGDYFI